MSELMSSQYFRDTELRVVQYCNLIQLLKRTSALNDFWKTHLATYGFDIGKMNRIGNLEFLPIIDKIFYRKLKEFQYLVIMPGARARRYFTSGTSGIPFVFFIDDVSSAWRYIMALRGNGWVGYRDGDKFLRIFRYGYPDPMLDFAKSSTIFYEWRKKDRHYEFIKNCSDRPILLYGFIEFFRLLMNITPPHHTLNIRAIIVTGERLNEAERRLFESFFRAPVYASYSSREFGRIAQECEYQNGYHINAERFYIEIVNEAGERLTEDNTGRIIITDTKNFIMPFIRFDIGDTGFISRAPCRCGRTLPRLFVNARNTDYLQLYERIESPHLLFRIIDRQSRYILRYQIIQEDIDRFTVIISTLPGFSEATSKRIVEEFKKILSEGTAINVKHTNTDFITKNGKQLPFISFVRRQESV